QRGWVGVGFQLAVGGFSGARNRADIVVDTSRFGVAHYMTPAAQPYASAAGRALCSVTGIRSRRRSVQPNPVHPILAWPASLAGSPRITAAGLSVDHQQRLPLLVCTLGQLYTIASRRCLDLFGKER